MYLFCLVLIWDDISQCRAKLNQRTDIRCMLLRYNECNKNTDCVVACWIKFHILVSLQILQINKLNTQLIAMTTRTR